jgi:hypothetical protein
MLIHASLGTLETTGILVPTIAPNHSQIMVATRALSSNHSETVLGAARR